MPRKTEFKKGDRVVLLSVPGLDRGQGPVTDLGLGAGLLPGVGETHTVDRVRTYPGETWYDVAGWCVRAENLERAD